MTIKNINKKILSGILAVTVLTTPLAGCKGSTLKYEENSQGKFVCVDNIKYEYLKEYKVLVLGNKDDMFFYIAKEQKIDDYGSRETYTEYYDIFGGNLVYTDNTESDLKMITVTELRYYLFDHNLIKKEYTEQDVKKILEIVKDDFMATTEKQLVK